MTTYSRDISTDTANAKVNVSDLLLAIRASTWTPAFLGVRVKGDGQADGTITHNAAVGKFDIEFDAALPAGEETQLDDLLAAHAGNPIVVARFVAAINILEKEHEITKATWQEFGGVVADVSSFVNKMTEVLGVLTGSWKSVGAGGQIRACEEAAGGDNVLGTFNVPDTADMWVPFKVYTDTPPTAGLQVFKIEEKQGAATSLSVKYLTLSLYRVRVKGA